MSIVPEFYLNAVVSIGIRTNNDIAWIGTGFFTLRTTDKDGSGLPFLVTNRHVFEKSHSESIVLRLRKTDSDLFETADASIIKDGKPMYTVHPNPKIDIAVLPLNGPYFVNNGYAFDRFNIDTHAMTSAEFRENGVDAGSLVHMLGFPMGLVNVSSRLPICRLGCVARMCEAQINETHNIIIDIQNFPGNSGSPIITRPENNAIQGTKAFNKSFLLGIVHSYIPYEDSLISSQTSRVVEIRSENSGLALVHPVEYIREVIDLLQPVVTFTEPETAVSES